MFYDGKRGLLEVWPMHGPRIAAFKVTSNSQLIYNPHGIIMYNESKPVKRNSHGSLLLLMDPNGQLKEIIVPFHFSMAYENSDRAKDVHIVKKLRQFIKEKKLSYEELENEVISVVKELKTIDVKIYILEMLLSIKKIPPTIILECIKKFEDDVPNEEKANNKLIILCSNLTALLQIYILVHADGKNYIDDKENACESLLSEPQIEKFESLLNYAASLQHKRTAILQKVSFQDEVEHAYSDFIMCFDIYSTNEYLSIKNEASLETLNYLSQQLFENFIKGTHCCKALLIELQKYKSFTNYDLVKLLIIYFTNIPIQEIDKNKIINFEKVLYELCEIEGFNIISKSYNETSPWWYFIREVLINASCPFRSMVTAELCRAVAIQIEKQVDNGQSEIDETTWETMSKDRAQWGMLIGKLDDISLLSIILSQKQEQIKEVPTLPIDVPEINLKYIYTNGRGSISEIIAKWLCIAGISPKTVATQSDINDNKEIELKTHVINKTISTYDKLSVLRKQFPFSLHPDSVITYMCWEYSKAWFKNIQDVQFLHTIVECLNYITNIPMRCGICFMIWSTHLVNVFESAFKLISKVGKLPKERLCQQDVQMSDAQLLRFLEIISDFLNTFLCSCLSMNETSTLLKFEPIWDNDIPALTEHALQNSKINIDVLQIHYQLATAIYYQCYLGCNFFKHLSCLFDVQSQKCMFTSLKSNEMILGHGAIDSRVQFQREQFLKVLVDKCKYLKIERYTMLDKILDLARIWRIDGDAIRRTDVRCKIYNTITNTNNMLEKILNCIFF